MDSALEPVTCEACGGVYRPFGADGLRYYHACSLIPNPRYQPDAQAPAFDPVPYVRRSAHRDENIDARQPPNPDGEQPRNATGQQLAGGPPAARR